MCSELNALGRAAARMIENRRRKAFGELRPESRGFDTTSGAGEVTSIGQFVVEGWIGTSQAQTISLRIDGLTALKVQAKPDKAGKRVFRFEVRGVWDFVGSDSIVSIYAGDIPLPIRLNGDLCGAVSREISGTFKPSDLTKRFAEGFVFSHSGVLQLSKKVNSEWQALVLNLYSEVNAILAEREYQAFLCYGSLLGAIREGGYIGHDMDFDAAYVSREADGPAAATELVAIAKALIDAGLDVDCQAESLHIHDREHRDARIDLFHLYFDEPGVLRFPFGVAGTTPVTSAQWNGLEAFELPGGQALVPVAAEAVVALTYGDTWRTPDPSFSWSQQKLELASEGQLTKAQRDEVHRYWVRTHVSHLTGSERRYAMKRRARRVIRRAAVAAGLWPDSGAALAN